jgi:hypothetical protein
MLGDFNEILYGAEKEGGNAHPQRCMQAFRSTLEDCNLEDMGLTETYSRGDEERLGKDWIGLCVTQAGL